MIFGQDRAELRQMYVDAWKKSSMNIALSSLEAQIAKVIEDHPEYHDMLTADTIDKDFVPEGGQTNPFLHMGLHLAIRDQISTNRPSGIAVAFKKLLTRTGDAHKAEHLALECLAETLWEAQRNKTAPDEASYLLKILNL
tara:strand:+ start:2150 stop:2569 length:420 start_codon:yes stop_codon:yes gene_type:complete